MPPFDISRLFTTEDIVPTKVNKEKQIGTYSSGPLPFPQSPFKFHRASQLSCNLSTSVIRRV